jgi:inorganic pyrophosphatase
VSLCHPPLLLLSGGLPQTWENSNRTDNTTGFIGDHDPVDVLDIGAARAPIGGVYRVKVRQGLL